MRLAWNQVKQRFWRFVNAWTSVAGGAERNTVVDVESLIRVLCPAPYVVSVELVGRAAFLAPLSIAALDRPRPADRPDRVFGVPTVYSALPSPVCGPGYFRVSVERLCQRFSVRGRLGNADLCPRNLSLVLRRKVFGVPVVSVAVAERPSTIGAVMGVCPGWYRGLSATPAHALAGFVFELVGRLLSDRAVVSPDEPRGVPLVMRFQHDGLSASALTEHTSFYHARAIA